MQEAARLKKPLSESVLDDLHEELWDLSLQLDALSELVQHYGMQGFDLDNRRTNGLGLILEHLTDHVYKCFREASEWRHWEDRLREKDNMEE